MVVAHEVKEAMDRELLDLPGKGSSGGLCLRARGLDRDVDLAQKEGPIRVHEVPRLGEREGKDVGGPVDLEKIAIQGADARVVGEYEGNRGAREAQKPERAPEKRLKSGRS